ncbi:MAG: PEP-CTERM sorting domain-containing protein [Rariglobus sp.]|nr:PEP-CTERM sorting domain-containing protein [Rariglobus sp.]
MKTPSPSPLDLRLGLNRGVLRKTLSVLAPLFACATFSHAAVLLSENFNGLNTGNLGGQNNWTANAALQVAAGGLSYTSTSGTIKVLGGTQHSTWTNANIAPLGSKNFVSQTGDVWFSLTINVTATTTNSRFWFYVSNDADLNDSGVVGQIFSGSGALGTGARIGSNQTGPTGASTTLPGQTTLFIVGHYSQSAVGGTATVGDYDKMEMWVNPDSTTLGVGFTAINTTDASGATAISTFALSALTASGTGATVLWDNLLVGTTQADVLDVYAIPEPSTYAAIGGLAALGLATLRRRRG